MIMIDIPTIQPDYADLMTNYIFLFLSIEQKYIYYAVVFKESILTQLSHQYIHWFKRILIVRTN
jgi:hypothetical protein